jgi:molybdopterin-guanine dinucleotide biosynthesis protein B
VEGYKRAPIPKLEVWRAVVGKPPLHPLDPAIVGVATDAPETVRPGLRVFGLDEHDAIATFVDERAAPPAGID